MADEPTTSLLIILELGGRKRELDLVGAGLPAQGAEWGSKLVMETVWNPGNPEGVQHVMVPTEIPSAWTGKWNTTRLVSAPPQFSEAGGSKTPIVLADTLRDTFEDMHRSGQLLQVTWIAKENRRISRFGRISEVHFKHRGVDDIDWDATFEWQSRTTTRQLPSFDESLLAVARASALAASNAAGYAEVQKINAANPRVLNGPSRFTLGQVEALAKAPQQFVAGFTRKANQISSRLRQVTNILVTLKDTPFAVAGQAVDAATEAVGAANQFVDRLTRQGPEQQTLDTRVQGLLRAARYYNGAQTQAELMASENQRLRVAGQAARVPSRPSAGAPSTATAAQTLTTYLPSRGETMLKIAMRYYNDDLSAELSRANGLPMSTIIAPRTALIIPQRAVLERLRGT